MKRATLLLVAVAVTGLFACSSGSSKGAVSPSTTAPPPSTTGVTPTTSAKVARVQSGDRYVALGSSIASGYGIANQSTACGRSDRDYGQLVAAKLDLSLTDVSCGAAVIPNVLDTSQGSAPPQIDAVTPDTKLITISIGGNDINLNATALGCGNPATVCSPPATLGADEAALQGKLVDMLAQLKAKAPPATIVLVTYPREFPDQNCAALSLTDGSSPCSGEWARSSRQHRWRPRRRPASSSSTRTRNRATTPLVRRPHSSGRRVTTSLRVQGSRTTRPPSDTRRWQRSSSRR